VNLRGFYIFTIITNCTHQIVILRMPPTSIAAVRNLTYIFATSVHVAATVAYHVSAESAGPLRRAPAVTAHWAKPAHARRRHRIESLAPQLPQSGDAMAGTCAHVEFLCAQPASALALAVVGLLMAVRAAIRLALWVYAGFLRPGKPLRRRYGAWAVVTGATDGIGCGRARPPPSCLLSPRRLPSPSLHGRGWWGARARRFRVRLRRGGGRDRARALELGVHPRVRRASASMGGWQG